MRKFFFLLMAMTTIVACQKDMNEVAGSVQNDESATENPYAISQEEAIANLEAFLGAFEAETRSTQRSIKSIEAVEYSDIVNTTRSSEEIDIDNLLYIVEFEDGQGSAVIGADRRVESVYAVLDESVLTVQDFENAANGVETDDISTYTAGLIAQSAANSVYSGTIPPEVDLTYDETEIIEYLFPGSHVRPMLNTKWHQSSPYNNLYPTKTGPEGNTGRAPAGCGVIAVGQLLTYLQPTTTITLNGHTHHYADMAQFTYDNNVTDPTLVNKLAQFIYDISEDMNAIYAYDSTSTTRSQAAQTLRHAGLSNVNVAYYDYDDICEMINDNKPVWLRGKSSDDGGAHAWIIDGIKSGTMKVVKVTKRDGVVISSETLDTYVVDYVHCNYGWGGISDGFYHDSIFTSSRCIYREYEYGDQVGYETFSYDTGLRMIKYNL